MQPAAPPYPAPPPAPPARRGFPTWAIVLLSAGGALVLFGGILVVLAIYGVRKYIANAKQAEARNSVVQIGKDAAEAYEAEAPGSTGGAAHHRMCPSASRPVPSSLAQVSGKKYQSSPADWEVDAASDAGFACLKFELDMPQYYQYSYAATPTSFTATAQGDLDGNGVPSRFVVRGSDAASTGTLDVAPTIEETNPQE